MKKLQSLLLGVALVLGACSNDEDVLGDDYVPLMVDVDLQTPERVDVGESVRIVTEVAQGGEAITDADEVIYEIWEETNKIDGKMVEANNEGDGTYTIDETFERDSIMNVQVHVTARGLHVMPVHQIVVGEGKEYEDEEESDFNAYIQTVDVESGSETMLIAHLTEKGIPTTIDTVQLIVYVDDEQPEMLVVEHDGKGEYRAPYTFSKAGFAKLEVRVNGEDGEPLYRTMQTINVR